MLVYLLGGKTIILKPMVKLKFYTSCGIYEAVFVTAGIIHITVIMDSSPTNNGLIDSFLMQTCRWHLLLRCSYKIIQ